MQLLIKASPASVQVEQQPFPLFAEIHAPCTLLYLHTCRPSAPFTFYAPKIMNERRRSLFFHIRAACGCPGRLTFCPATLHSTSARAGFPSRNVAARCLKGMNKNYSGDCRVGEVRTHTHTYIYVYSPRGMRCIF